VGSSELAEETGLTRGVIRRSKLLADLPDEYKEIILKELHKPKPQQKLTEDFFIEMERALTTVTRAIPDVIQKRDRVRRILIDKYRTGVINNIVHFRKMARIARARYVGADEGRAKRSLVKLFDDNKYSIEEAYEASVSDIYEGKDLKSRVTLLIEKLGEMEEGIISDELREALTKLMQTLKEILRGG
jgi:ParB family chromosome partitioning protein